MRQRAPPLPIASAEETGDDHRTRQKKRVSRRRQYGRERDGHVMRLLGTAADDLPTSNDGERYSLCASSSSATRPALQAAARRFVPDLGKQHSADGARRMLNVCESESNA